MINTFDLTMPGICLLNLHHCEISFIHSFVIYFFVFLFSLFFFWFLLQFFLNFWKSLSNIVHTIVFGWEEENRIVCLSCLDYFWGWYANIILLKTLAHLCCVFPFIDSISAIDLCTSHTHGLNASKYAAINAFFCWVKRAVHLK